MSFKNIYVGDYGQVAKITFIDVDAGTAADISSYSTTKQMIFTDPSGTVMAKTATFDTDGTDGVIKYTIESDLFDAAGWWKVRGRVSTGTTQLTTEQHQFYVSA